MRTIKFQLNGEAREVEASPDEPLLDVLRETFKLKSLKSGCAPQRVCGACLALIGGDNEDSLLNPIFGPSDLQ